MKKIKDLLLILVALGAVSPIISFTLPVNSFNINLSLLNLGLKSTLAAIIIIFLALHRFYLNEKMTQKLSLAINVINLVLILIVLFLTRLEINKLIDSLGFFSQLVNGKINYSWGWLLMLIPNIISLAINIFELKNKNKLIESEIIEETQTNTDEEI